MAVVSKDAKVDESTLTVTVEEENFSSKGTILREKNFMEVWPYQRVAEATLPSFDLGDDVALVSAKMKEGRTTAPEYLTEAELISAMDKEGIGTDATIATHIGTIQKRKWASTNNPKSQFKPTETGIALVDAYQALGSDMDLSKSELRKYMEDLMKEIEMFTKTKEEVLDLILDRM